MAENVWEKYRAEREKNQNIGLKHGKQTDQKLKPYVILQLPNSPWMCTAM